MTPTDRDKELREAIRKDFHQLLVKEFTADWKIQRIVRDLEIDVISLDNTMQLITADRKRVALEARISELKMWELPENEIQMVFANPCNICGLDYPKLRKAQQDRLSALKAQQEEV